MNKIVLSILCIASLATAVTTHAAWYDWIPGISWFTNKNCLVPNIYNESQHYNRKICEANLKDNVTGKYLGSVAFNYDKASQSGEITHLHVRPEERNHGYGSTLLKYALEKLSIHCNEIYLIAHPQDLKPNQTKQEMLPKLIAFYQRHDAHLLRKHPSKPIAWMVYYPKSSPRSRQFTRLG
jgi:GNAT superfamily N-acetyltransferase